MMRHLIPASSSNVLQRRGRELHRAPSGGNSTASRWSRAAVALEIDHHHVVVAIDGVADFLQRRAQIADRGQRLLSSTVLGLLISTIDRPSVSKRWSKRSRASSMSLRKTSSPA